MLNDKYRLISIVLVFMMSVVMLLSPLQSFAEEGATRENTITVMSFDELKGVLTGKQAYNVIYIGADIIGKVGGIRIDAIHKSVILDGKLEDGSYATYTEYGSAAFADTIRAEVVQTVNVTMRNMNIVGSNFYGPLSVYDAVKGAKLTYENINYEGPQLAHNRYGTVHLHNVKFVSKAGVSATQEVAEATHISLSGKIDITIGVQTGVSTFWFVQPGATLTVESGADVNIATIGYLVYTDAQNLAVTIKENAKFKLENSTGFTYASQSIESLVIEKDAVFSVNQLKTSGYASLLIKKTLTVMQGAEMRVISSNVSLSVIQFTTVMATATFANPKLVLWYAPSGKLFQPLGSLAEPSKLIINADTINRWSTADLGPNSDSMNNMPDGIWNKKMGEISLEANFPNTQMNNLTSNLEVGDPISKELTPTTLNLLTAKMLAFGESKLDINPFTTIDKEITGITSPNAEVKVNYVDSTSTSQEVMGKADAGGGYAVSLGANAPQLHSEAKVISHLNMLKKRQNTIVIEGEEQVLEFMEVPKLFSFLDLNIPEVSTIYPRTTGNFKIKIKDTRQGAGGWKVEVSLRTPLSGEANGKEYTLPTGLVFVDSKKIATPLSDMPLTVYQSEIEPERETEINWTENEGVLLSLASGEGQTDVVYKGTINWTLSDTP